MPIFLDELCLARRLLPYASFQATGSKTSIYPDETCSGMGICSLLYRCPRGASDRHTRSVAEGGLWDHRIWSDGHPSRTLGAGCLMRF